MDTVGFHIRYNAPSTPIIQPQADAAPMPVASDVTSVTGQPAESMSSASWVHVADTGPHHGQPQAAHSDLSVQTWGATTVASTSIQPQTDAPATGGGEVRPATGGPQSDSVAVAHCPEPPAFRGCQSELGDYRPEQVAYLASKATGARAVADARIHVATAQEQPPDAEAEAADDAMFVSCKPHRELIEVNNDTHMTDW